MVTRNTLLVVVLGLLFLPMFVYAQICPGGICIIPPDDPCFAPIKPPECFGPPPENEDPEPIVFVPGLMTSFNWNVIIRDDGTDGEWGYLSGTETIYRALTERLQQAGLDVTVAHYDWRKPATENRSYLIDAIADAKAGSSNGKVDIVSHSFGGLVARDYIQSNGYQGDVDQLITLGTPHKGSADAYLALEGGVLPDRWGVLVRTYIGLVEAALVAQDGSSLPRPQTFRQYFPSLRDIFPIEPFVNQSGNLLAFGELDGFNNIYLKYLNDTIDNSFGFGPNKVELTTIAGSGLDTLDKIAVNDPANRSILDRIDSRWRDGRPQPDPPPADTDQGDQTVLLASARLDSTPEIAGANHDKLPEEAQEEVLAVLDNVESTGTHIAYDIPDSVLGTVVLSPVIPVITFPDGSVFRCDETKKENSISCVTDNNDLEGPKLLVIADPPEGDYEITLEPVGDGGDYHLITSLADGDGDSVVTESGTAEPGQNIGYYFSVSLGAEQLSIEVIDVKDLLRKIRQLTRQARREKDLRGYQRANIIRSVNHALRDLRIYERRMKQGREDAARSRLRSYYGNLREIEREAERLGLLEIVELVEKVRTYSPVL